MARKTRNIKLFFLYLFIVIIILFILLQTDWFWRLIYPLEYKEHIEYCSRENNLDAALVSAMIYVESKFKPDAVSSKGAMGLMQIMPDTGNWIAEQLDYSNFDLELLFDPEINILFGTWYLQMLRREFDNNSAVVLAAYNAGRGNVKKWLEEEWDGREQSIENIPYNETKEYVKKIISAYRYYNRIYEYNLVN
ncbi:MAG TPA: lytic transglycosylase domain-containing protein [Halanaerobiales bacterium]|nr:lytic transglycosylase domain-containing protein [Halanaerobiales bacterium]